VLLSDLLLVGGLVQSLIGLLILVQAIQSQVLQVLLGMQALMPHEMLVTQYQVAQALLGIQLLGGLGDDVYMSI
jgi:UPF0716 family protein affecting phage T7 exclusion